MKTRILSLLSTLLLGLTLTHTAQANPTLVMMETNMGNIELQLNEEKAPKTVANFLRYVDEGFYNGTIFHRVISGFMIQGGGFTPDMDQKRPHAPVQNEADNGLANKPGTIAMARTSDPHSATAQFFINHANNKLLNHSGKTPRGWGYAVFGKVISGMETVNAIADVHTGTAANGMGNFPEKTVIIKSVSRITE